MAPNKIITTAERFEEFQKHLKHKYPGKSAESAFIAWHVASFFPKDAERNILDGKSDGGLDAIVSWAGCIYIIQYKFSINIHNKLQHKVLHELDAAEHFLTDKSSSSAGPSKFNPVSKNVLRKYRDLLRGGQAVGLQRLVVTTMHPCKVSDRTNIEVHGIEDVLYLHENTRDAEIGSIPSIDVKYEAKWEAPSSDGIRSFILLADAHELVRYLAHDKLELLFAPNIRGFSPGRVTDDMRLTCQQEPEHFWLYNNGVYIICHDIEELKGKSRVLRLHLPGVINGGQTLRSVRAANIKKRCPLLVRIGVMNVNTHRKMVRNIIGRTNSQIPVKSIQLKAHDTVQLLIKKDLFAHGIFYENKTNDWRTIYKSLYPNLQPVKMKDAMQYLAAITLDAKMLGMIRSSFTKIVDENYDAVYANFNKQTELPKALLQQRQAIVIGQAFDRLSRSAWARNEGIASELKWMKFILMRLFYDQQKNNLTDDITLQYLKERDLQSFLVDKLRTGSAHYVESARSFSSVHDKAAKKATRINLDKETKSSVAYDIYEHLKGAKLVYKSIPLCS